MDIQQLISFDQHLLLSLNGSDSLFWDGFMWIVTSTKTWIPAALALLYIIFKNNKWQQGVLIIFMIALVVLLADQTASGICKPFFARYRPTHDPEIMYLVDTVNNYRGGLYGFISSHASNTFGVAMLISLIVGNTWLTITMFLWAAIPTYSRIYLGVHYPGDIFFGAIDGLICGVLVFLLYRFICRRFFTQQRYISAQYTQNGYSVQSIGVLTLVLLLTYFIAVIWGMIVSKNMYF